MMIQSATVRGDWLHVAEGPLLVSDPLKARWLMGLDRNPPSARASKRHAAGVLPVSLFRQACQTIPAAARHELEKLLSGGNELWRAEYANLVVNQGLNEILDVTIGGQVNDTSWFVGLTDGTPTTAPGDTMASHAGWVEQAAGVAYDVPAARPAWTPNGVSSAASVSNSVAPASYTIMATVTIGGSFLVDVNSTNGTGNSLYSAGAFTAGDKLLNDNDTLAVTATFTTAAA